MRLTSIFPKEPWEIVKIHVFFARFFMQTYQFQYRSKKSWISMISQGFMGNLGVNLIQPSKLCAGLKPPTESQSVDC